MDLGATASVFVQRREFLLCLRHLSSEVRRTICPEALVTYEDGMLAIRVGMHIEEIPADGTWSGGAFVGKGWPERIRRKPPDGDVLLIRVEDGRLFVQAYSEPCRWVEGSPEYTVPEPAPPDPSEAIAKAAQLLAPFHVGQERLRELVGRRPDELGITGSPRGVRRIVQAWAVLAPFGVSAGDLEAAVEESVRRAWMDRKL